MSLKSVFALIALPVLLCSCGKTEEEVPEGYILFEGETNIHSGITSEISQLPFDSSDGSSTVKITVTNDSEQGKMMVIDVPSEVQKKINGKWYSLPTDYGIAGHCAGIESGESLCVGEAWLSLYDPLEPGHYRAVTDYSFYEEYDFYFLSCEFEVE